MTTSDYRPGRIIKDKPFPRTTYRIHGCSWGKVVNDHGTDDLAVIIRLEREWKNDSEMTSISIYRDAELVKEWRRQ